MTYPDIFVIHREFDQSVSWGSDITHVHIDKGLSSWTATEEFSTPENASQILDVSPAVNHLGQGMHVLYVTQGKTKLYGRFIRPDPMSKKGSMFSDVTNVPCPTGKLEPFSSKGDHTY